MAANAPALIENAVMYINKINLLHDIMAIWSYRVSSNLHFYSEILIPTSVHRPENQIEWIMTHMVIHNIYRGIIIIPNRNPYYRRCSGLNVNVRASAES